MDGELLSLKWNNHRTTFYHVISGLRNKESYTDVTLACDGKFYPVHKLVLSTCSEYFNDIFERTNCKNPVVILKDIQCSDLEFLLDYMYIGEVNVRQNELSSLIKAAECLRVKGLAVPDEEPKKSSSSSSRQRPEQQSPPLKRRRTEDRRNTDHSPGRPPDTRRGSSSSANSEIREINPARDVNPSQRSDDPPPRRDQNSSSDQDVGTPIQQIKLEKDEGDQDIYIQSNSFDGGGDGPDTEGDSATDFPEFLQSNIEKEEPMSMSDYNPSDFAGPSGIQNSGVPTWDGDSSGFTESLSGAVAAAVAAAQQPGPQQQQQQQLWNIISGGSCVDGSSDVVVQRQVESNDIAAEAPGAGGLSVKCPVCGKVISRRDNLRVHLRTHTGERPYPCPHCPHRSNTRGNLYKHIRCMHENQEFSEQISGTQFLTSQRSNSVNSSLAEQGQQNSSFSQSTQSPDNLYRDRPSQFSLKSHSLFSEQN